MFSLLFPKAEAGLVLVFGILHLFFLVTSGDFLSIEQDASDWENGMTVNPNSDFNAEIIVTGAGLQSGVLGVLFPKF